MDSLRSHTTNIEPFTNMEYFMFIGTYTIMFSAVAYFLFCFLDLFFDFFQNFKDGYQKADYVNRIMSVVHALLVIPFAFIATF